MNSAAELLHGSSRLESPTAAQISRERAVLGSALATSQDRRRAMILALLLAMAFALTAPIASHPLVPLPSFVPTYNVAIVIMDLITSLLLYSQYRELKEHSLLALACGYTFAAVVALVHALSFPDAFIRGTLLGNDQTTAYLWMVWHGGFPFFVIAYAILARAERREGALRRHIETVRTSATYFAITLLAALCCIVVAAFAPAPMPKLMAGSEYSSNATRLILTSAWIVHLAAICTLLWCTRIRRVIDIWITVMLTASLIDLALSALLVTGRYQFGFYVGRCYGFLASCFVLAVLLRHAVGLQGHLASTVRALHASELRFRHALDIDTVGVVFFDERGRITDANDAFLALVGHTRAELRASQVRYKPLTAPEWDHKNVEVLSELNRTGHVTPFEKEYIRTDGTPIWILCAGKKLCDGEMVEFILDVTTRKRAEAAERQAQERQTILLAELQHRVRNLLAMVRAVVHRTLEEAEDVTSATRELEGRLSALARTQALLTRAAGATVNLRSLVEDELFAQIEDPSRIELSGPTVELGAKAAEVLTLAIHELTTNAAKYGAIAYSQARLEIRWDTQQRDADGPPWLHLEWQEIGVPMEKTPPRVGFGTELVTHRVPYELGGQGSLEHSPTGVRCTISFPLALHSSVLQTSVTV